MSAWTLCQSWQTGVVTSRHRGRTVLRKFLNEGFGVAGFNVLQATYLEPPQTEGTSI